MKSFDQLRPTHIAKTVEGITPELLSESGLGLDRIGAIAFDVDGTLMAHHETRVEHSVYKTLRGLADASYSLYIISNAYGDRVDELRSMFEYDGVEAKVITPEYVTPRGESTGKYRKPSSAMLKRVSYETDGDVLMVGDQMVKDVWSANRADMPSVLVPRRGDGDDPRVKYLQRPLETAARIYLDLPRTADEYPDTLKAA
jgi:HAD superfamily hydrolase (TIGR01662 family)